MTIFPVNKANVCKTVFIYVGACLLDPKQESRDDTVSLTWVPEKFRVSWPFGYGEEVLYTVDSRYLDLAYLE